MKQKILVTGIAGTGKSTVCRTLASKGVESYGIEDLTGMFAMYRKGTDELFEDFDNADPEKVNASEWLCNVRMLQELLARQNTNLAFYCGVASNMDEIIPLFDKVLLLSVSPKTLYAHLLNREGTDDMGNTEASRQSVLGWKEWWENEMKNRGAIVVSAEGSPEMVAKLVLASV